MNKSSILFKLGIIFSLFFIITVFLLSSINIFIANKNFKTSEEEKVKIVLDTINPIIALNLSFGFSDTLSETMDTLFKNRHILAVKITNEDKIIYLKYKDKKYKEAFDKVNLNYFYQTDKIKDPFSDEKIASISIVYSSENYINMIREYRIYLFISITLTLIFFIFVLKFIYKQLLPLKNLSDKMKSFSPKQKNFTIEEIKGESEIAIINNSAKIMVDKINEYTNKLEDINKNLKNQVLMELKKSREKDKLLIKQSRQAAMGEMIGNIAHQWRQPLNALSLVLQNIQFTYKRGKLDEAQIERTVTKSTRLINKMSTTIDDFRNFFKPNKQKENFYLEKAITDSISLVEASFKNHNISVEVQKEDIGEINGYPNEFSQVILNLLSNAKDIFLERNIQNAKVIISIYKENSNIIVDVKDNGGGIKEDIIDKIFEPYFTTKDEGKGTGIGLYMSKMIIEDNMNGKLIALNEKKGAIFKIILPI